MTITTLHCPACDITVNGGFSSDRFALLDDETNDFIEVFLLSRGNIKEIEKKLGISYPTVKSKIDKMVNEVMRVKHMEEELADAKKKQQEEAEKSEQRIRKITKDK
jgi:hypothetical protein